MGGSVHGLEGRHYIPQVEIGTPTVKGRHLGKVMREVFVNHGGHLSRVRFNHGRDGRYR